MAKIYSNENLPLPVVEELRQLGHDVLTTYESGKAGQAVSDEEMLEFAVDEERILITFNRKHFIRLHKESSEYTGIIVCTFDPDFVALAQRIHVALTENPQMEGQLLRINRPLDKQ
jgi:hypothetical protein